MNPPKQSDYVKDLSELISDRFDIDCHSVGLIIANWILDNNYAIVPAKTVN